jgi:hypothetical protein
MEFYSRTYLDTATGAPVNGATVTVYTLSGSPATIYDRLGGAQANPFSTGLNRAEGEIEFAAVGGLYDVKIVNGLETDWLYAQGLFDPDTAQAPDFYTDTGVANAYVLSGGNATEYVNGLQIRFVPTNNNTGGSSVDVNGLGSKLLRTIGSYETPAGSIDVRDEVIAYYDSSSGRFLCTRLYLPTATVRGIEVGSETITTGATTTVPFDILENIGDVDLLWEPADYQFRFEGYCVVSVTANINYSSSANGFRRLEIAPGTTGSTPRTEVTVLPVLQGTGTSLTAAKIETLISNTRPTVRCTTYQSSGGDLDLSTSSIQSSFSVSVLRWL